MGPVDKTVDDDVALVEVNDGHEDLVDDLLVRPVESSDQLVDLLNQSHVYDHAQLGDIDSSRDVLVGPNAYPVVDEGLVLPVEVTLSTESGHRDLQRLLQVMLE